MRRKPLIKRKLALILFVVNGIFLVYPDIIGYMKFVFKLFGIALMCLGIICIIDHGNMSEIVGSSLYISGVYMIIFLGLMALFVSGCGYVAAERENLCILITYIVILTILILFLVIAGIMVLAFRDSLGKTAHDIMVSSIQSQYGRYKIITDAWNLTQNTLRCCGVDDLGWGVYTGSWWDTFVNTDVYESNAKLLVTSPFYKVVPESCCVRLIDGLTGWPTDEFRDVERCQTWQYGPPNKPSGAHNDAIYYAGCFESLKSYINAYAKPLGALSLLAAIVLILALVTTIMLFIQARAISRNNARRMRPEYVPYLDSSGRQL